MNSTEKEKYLIGYIESELLTIMGRITGGKITELSEVMEDIDDILENIQKAKDD